METASSAHVRKTVVQHNKHSVFLPDWSSHLPHHLVIGIRDKGNDVSLW